MSQSRVVPEGGWNGSPRDWPSQLYHVTSAASNTWLIDESSTWIARNDAISFQAHAANRRLGRSPNTRQTVKPAQCILDEQYTPCHQYGSTECRQHWPRHNCTITTARHPSCSRYCSRMSSASSHRSRRASKPNQILKIQALSIGAHIREAGAPGQYKSNRSGGRQEGIPLMLYPKDCHSQLATRLTPTECMVQFSHTATFPPTKWHEFETPPTCIDHLQFDPW